MLSMVSDCLQPIAQAMNPTVSKLQPTRTQPPRNESPTTKELHQQNNLNASPSLVSNPSHPTTTTLSSSHPCCPLSVHQPSSTHRTHPWHSVTPRYTSDPAADLIPFRQSAYKAQKPIIISSPAPSPPTPPHPPQKERFGTYQARIPRSSRTSRATSRRVHNAAYTVLISQHIHEATRIQVDLRITSQPRSSFWYSVALARAHVWLFAFLGHL